MKVVDWENGKEWTKGFYEPAAMIDMTVEEVANRLGATYLEYDNDGLGSARALCFKLNDGRQFFIEQLLQAPKPYDRQICLHCNGGNSPADRISNAAFEMEVIAALKALSVRPEKLTWVQEGVDMDRVQKALRPAPGLGGGKPGLRP